MDLLFVCMCLSKMNICVLFYKLLITFPFFLVIYSIYLQKMTTGQNNKSAMFFGPFSFYSFLNNMILIRVQKSIFGGKTTIY